MSYHKEYSQWPFLTQEEFELACALFDQRYVNAKLGPTRKIFKIRTRRTITTGASYIEIVRLLNLGEDDDDDELLKAMGKLNRPSELNMSVDMDIDMANEHIDEVCLSARD